MTAGTVAWLWNVVAVWKRWGEAGRWGVARRMFAVFFSILMAAGALSFVWDLAQQILG
jgi:hypothetical protein